jgi:hypothetical protein
VCVFVSVRVYVCMYVYVCVRAHVPTNFGAVDKKDSSTMSSGNLWEARVSPAHEQRQ